MCWRCGKQRRATLNYSKGADWAGLTIYIYIFFWIIWVITLFAISVPKIIMNRCSECFISPIPVYLTITTLWANSSDHKLIGDAFLIFLRKQDLTLHANWRQFAWSVKSCLLGKIRKIFQYVVRWKFYPESSSLKQQALFCIWMHNILAPKETRNNWPETEQLLTQKLSERGFSSKHFSFLVT